MNVNELSYDEFMEKINDLCCRIRGSYPSQNNNHYEKEPFNIILASYDLFYRENYHSDIISFILKDKKYVVLFIKYLKTIGKNEIKYEDYLNPIVTRENDRIDVLIKDVKTKHCIIIENKIHNAKDTTRQLPNYYCLLTNKGYNVDVIVYLTLDGQKNIDKITWTPQDHKLGLDEIILFCTVSNKSDSDFINGFLCKCLLEANSTLENM
jgi:hypothetical protein